VVEGEGEGSEEEEEIRGNWEDEKREDERKERSREQEGRKEGGQREGGKEGSAGKSDRVSVRRETRARGGWRRYVV
jgi:hypothetical protein